MTGKTRNAETAVLEISRAHVEARAGVPFLLQNFRTFYNVVLFLERRKVQRPL